MNEHERAELAGAPQIAIVIFDSTQPINTGRGLYVSAHVEPLADPEIDYSMIGPGMPRASVNLPA